MAATIHKLTAGSGYDYLTRQVARHDATEVGHSGLGNYYSAKGEAPGVWVGAGMAGIGGLAVGDEVTAEHMTRLFGTGEHPLGDESGHSLGRPFRVYTGRDDISAFRIEVAGRFEQHNRSLGLPVDHPIGIEDRARIRTQVGLEMFRAEHGRDPFDERELAGLIAKQSRPRTTAVAGFDLTFSPVKSVSTLWAVADRPLADQIESAHQAAVRDALAYIEKHALFTRTGKDGVQQVDVRGLVAAAFTHRDSRAGDPDLHTHVAVANKVQTATDGRWLSIDGRVLFKAMVSASETYNTALEKHLAPLGLTFAPRAHGGDPRKRPVREIVGVDPALNQKWSSRRASIQVRRSELAATFQAKHGRPPTPVESIQLAQQATLETREAKHEPRSEAAQRGTWRAEALETLGGQKALAKMVTAALAGARTHGFGERVDEQWVERTAAQVVEMVQGSRSTWQVWHVRAEAQRHVRAADIPLEQVEDLVEQLTQAALARSMAMTSARADSIPEPEPLRRADGASVYTVAGSELFTSTAILEAEQRLVAAAGRFDGRRACEQDVDLALLECVANGVTLNAGQAALVRGMATSGARVQLAIAPAGSGKTTAMRALTKAWEAAGGTVIGLAPSAAAAGQLREHTGTTTDTLAQLVFRLNYVGLDGLDWATTIGPKTLVLIDEAGMADTLSLDTAITWLLAQGACVRLIGDDQQLGAIGAGGALRDIRATHGALHLSELMRFTSLVEGAASLELRDGRPSSLGFYLDAGRVHVGDLATMTEHVFTAWASDRVQGRDAIMLAPTRELVAELNQRARDHRLTGETKVGRQVSLADGNQASVGDVVLSRSNDRRLKVTRSDFVKNGDRWTVLKVGRNGSLVVQHNQHGRTIRLPADYVQESVELGYASTVHTAQGISVDVTHALATGDESRQQLYTMLTRGRHANHVYLEVVGDGDEHEATKPDTVSPRTATDLLETILARDEAPTSASTLLAQLDDPATLLGQASSRYLDALYTAAAHRVGQAQLDRLDKMTDRLVPGLTQAPAWPTLRAHLTLIAAASDDADPVQVLHETVTARPVDTAADPAAVLDWRLDDTGMRNTDPGPLPWIPGIPEVLTNDPLWGVYLTARAQRVTSLAEQVADQAVTGPTPPWASSQGAARPRDEVLAKVAVWRAANQMDDADLRPTGPAQPAKAAATYQASLRALVQGARTPALLEWGPLLAQVAPAAHQDPFTLVLVERLAAASRAGINAAALVRQAAATGGPLPDDHAAAALWWRIAEHLSPAVATSDATGTDQPLTTAWVPTLTQRLGADRTQAMQASTWWPALVTTVEHALQRGWSMDDLAATAPGPKADVDDAAAMTWTISTLMDDPTHLWQTADPYDEDDHELAAVGFEQHPASVQATDEDYRRHLDTLATTPPAGSPSGQPGEDLDGGGVNAGLVWAAHYRRFIGPLDPTNADLERAYERALQVRESPVPVDRLAQVNALALAFYEQQLTTGGWARAYLASRFGRDVAGHPHIRPGYAPAAWTRLADHLRGRGVTDLELQTTGLTTTTREGRLIDRFRDRAVFPITDTDGQVLGFVARRNPTLGDDSPYAGPKYLNTPTTPLYSKSHQLYGAEPGLLAAGATPVLVEGPIDAHAITLATHGAYVGVAPLGTALTQEQATQLARIGGPVIVATDADPAGRLASERAHWLLAQHNVLTFIAPLPQGTDPAQLLHDHGAVAVTNSLLTCSPLVEVLLEERLTNLPADEALEPAARVLATADPSSWDRTCLEIADRLGTDEATTRRALYLAVRAWHDNPRAVATQQLDSTRDVSARVQAAARQAPEQRWAPIADRLDPRLTAQEDWPALARTMQELHDEGQDIESLARASITDEPLVARRPAQALRYRLAANATTPLPGPLLTPRSSTVPRRDEDHRSLTPTHDRSRGVPR